MLLEPKQREMLHSLVKESFPKTTVSTKLIHSSLTLIVRESMDNRAELREFEVPAGSTISLSGKQTKDMRYFITTADGKYQLAFVEKKLERGNREILVIYVTITDFTKRDKVYYRRKPRGSFAS